ncbi:hypothetical protein LJC34_00330 [Oscillospiraceae bacterium OttesenSCG-928-G22]|nr:hypothetical protein [Oscillospiraceae bacterium OttesenSCG-928-G22]
MITLAITNDKYGQCLDLPASRWDMLAVKAKLHAEDFVGCKIRTDTPMELYQLDSVLRSIPRGVNFVEETDYLARQISGMPQDMREIFNNAISIYDPPNMQGLINLAHNTDSIIRIENIKDETALGEHLVHSGATPFPDDMIPFLDFEKIGAARIEGSNCAIVNGVFYDEPMGMVRIYDGFHLPEVSEQNQVFHISVCNPTHDPDSSLLADITLPATEAQMAGMLDVLYLDSPDGALVVSGRSYIADFQPLLQEGVRLESLNNLATTITEMCDADYIKFMAVAEHEQVLTHGGHRNANTVLEHLTYLASALDDYDFAPNITVHDIGSFGLVRASEPVQELVQATQSQALDEPQMGGCR